MKRALVTGGTGDIGSAICYRLAKQNYHVIVHTNSQVETAKQIVADIIQAGGSAEYCQFNIRDYAETNAKLTELCQEPIQVLVNNAGIHADQPLLGMQQEQWLNVIDVSLNGFFNVTQSMLMPMIRTRWGRIINISSVAGTVGNRGQCNYAAAKAGVIGATKSLAKEVATRGVTVNCIVPGIIDTGMIGDDFPEERIKQLVPMQRAGTADEIAASVAFLASEDAAYITGQNIVVDGGMT